MTACGRERGRCGPWTHALTDTIHKYRQTINRLHNGTKQGNRAYTQDGDECWDTHSELGFDGLLERAREVLARVLRQARALLEVEDAEWLLPTERRQ